MRSIACLLFASITLSSVQTPVSARQEPDPKTARDLDASKRDPAIELLVGAAEAAPAEFTSDTLLRLATSSRVPPDWRRELIEQAFIRAYAAQQPYRRSSTQVVSPDSRQGAILLGYSTALTRISLQVRAARLMTAVDPSRARELFEWIEVNPETASCEDLLVPDVEEYYGALGEVARVSYEGDRAGAFRFFESYLWRAYLPSEMPSVARAILSFRRGPIEAAYLEGLLRSLLDSGNRDARGFSSANGDIIARIADLQIADRKEGVPNWYFMDVLRDYLLVRLKEPRCADSASELRAPATFNGALNRVGASLDVKPLGSEVAPPMLLKSSRLDLYWQTADSRALHDAALRLWGPNRNPLPLRVRSTDDWKLRAEKFLEDLEPWAVEREAIDLDTFYQKAALFSVLVDLVPPGPLRLHTIRSYVEFLRYTEGDRSRRLTWFAFVARLLDSARAADRNEILDTLERTHHAVLSLYARMERVLPSTKP